jgi:hypothetical protein
MSFSSRPHFLRGSAATFGQSVADSRPPGNRIQKGFAESQFAPLVHG